MRCLELVAGSRKQVEVRMMSTDVHGNLSRMGHVTGRAPCYTDGLERQLKGSFWMIRAHVFGVSIFCCAPPIIRVSSCQYNLLIFFQVPVTTRRSVLWDREISDVTSSRKTILNMDVHMDILPVGGTYSIFFYTK